MMIEGGIKMEPEEMYEKEAIKKRIDKLIAEADYDTLHLFRRWIDETKKFVMRVGGRRGNAFIQFAMPWITLSYDVPDSTPEVEMALLRNDPPDEKELQQLRLKEKKIHKKIPHKDMQLHHLSRVRSQVHRGYRDILAKLQLDDDDDWDD
jgi:hypothetical protein